MKRDGNLYPVSSLYSIPCGLLRPFGEELKRFDLNILAKDEPQFASFRKALGSRMEMTAAGTGVKTNSADLFTTDYENQLWESGTIGFHSSKALRSGVFFCNCKIFGFWAMDEHVSLVEEQYKFGKDSWGEFMVLIGRVSKNVQGRLRQRKVNVKHVRQYAQPQIPPWVVRLFREYLKCIPGNGRFYRKPLPSVEERDMRFGIQPFGVTTLSKYLRSMCLDAKINLWGRRMRNHSCKVTCAATLYESEVFDEPTIMSRTAHRSVAVRSYKIPSDVLI